MGAVNRFLQIAQIIGFFTILGGVALAGAIAYLWWDSRQSTQEFEYGTRTAADEPTIEGGEDTVTAATGETADAETA